MSLTKPPSSPHVPTTKEHPGAPSKAFLQAIMILLLVAIVVIAWQLLNNSTNSANPTVAGRPLSNPHTHLHTIALGGRPGMLYLGTHYGLFTSTDGGRTWPQSSGVLNTKMIIAIAVSPVNPGVLAVLAVPNSGVGEQPAVYFSRDGGATWHTGSPSALSPSAYPYTIKAGAASQGHFYVFYNYAGWFETRDMGVHWYPITSGTLSNMQTPSLLTDPTNPDHLLLGGDQGLYESQDDGRHWHHIADVKGDVLSIVASNQAPRLILCATGAGMYRWHDGSRHITQLTSLPMTTPPTRLAIDLTGSALYALAGQDLWYSSDSGTSWKHRYHFDRGDLVALVLDPNNPTHLYAGFFLPAEVLYSADGASSWQILTD